MAGRACRPWEETRPLNRTPASFVPRRAVQLAQAFVKAEAASGMMLMAASVLAMAWANSAWAGQYFDLLHTPLRIDLSIVNIENDLQHWINDGFMTVFFFLMGLEIKREVVHGELSSPRRALLPVAAAAGGMLVPAAVYATLNAGQAGAAGWGIPMATDIAFALGILSLAGPRIPFSVRVFLLTLAIADDIGGILVIAAFYAEAINLAALLGAGLILGAVVLIGRLGVRNLVAYLALGICLWVAVEQSGVHPTLTGVALGLLTPATSFYDPDAYGRSADDLTQRYRRASATNNLDEQQGVLDQMIELSRGTEAPLERLERLLLPWSSFLIVPVFALANAGVAVSGGVAADVTASAVSQGVLLALVLGKPVGIVLATFLAVKLGICEMPIGASWRHIVGVGILGGIGFTVALLITGLAFTDPLLQDHAKLAVLAASIIAGSAGFLFLRFSGGPPVRQSGLP